MLIICSVYIFTISDYLVRNLSFYYLQFFIFLLFSDTIITLNSDFPLLIGKNYSKFSISNIYCFNGILNVFAYFLYNNSFVNVIFPFKYNPNYKIIKNNGQRTSHIPLTAVRIGFGALAYEHLTSRENITKLPPIN